MPHLFLATLMMWSSHAVLFPLSALKSECRDDFWAQCPAWIWCGMLGPLAIFLAAEVRALRFTIVPKYNVLKGRSICGVRVDFYLWLLFNSSVSAASFINQCLTSVFFGTVWMTVDCPVGERIHQLWEKTGPLRFVSPRSISSCLRQTPPPCQCSSAATQQKRGLL